MTKIRHKMTDIRHRKGHRQNYSSIVTEIRQSMTKIRQPGRDLISCLY